MWHRKIELNLRATTKIRVVISNSPKNSGALYSKEKGNGHTLMLFGAFFTYFR